MKIPQNMSLLMIILTLGLSACTVAKTTGKVITAPVKGVYHAGKGVYHAGKYTGKAAVWTGKRFVKTGETVVNVTNAALDTTSKVLTVTCQLIDVSGQIVTISSQISRAEIDATLETARQSKEIISILIDAAL